MPNEHIPPLALTQSYTRKYPGVWDRIDLLREKTVSGEIKAPWDFDLCWCPVAVAMGALEGYRNNTFGDAGFVAACAAWRRTKMIYRFDSALASELIDMASDEITVPAAVLRSLPAPAVYVQFEEPGGNGEITLDGFLVHIEDDVKTREKELRIDYITTDGTPALPIFLHLIPGGTVADGIRKAEETSLRNMRKNPLLPRDRKEAVLSAIRATQKTASEALQLILYICCENAEIAENEEQSKIYRKPTRITDRYRELRKWDVGVKTGVILRAMEKREREESADPEASPRNYTRIHKSRPHVRRAHWHHFWTGSGDNKKLILRWINTTLVNAEDGETSPVVIPLK